MQTSALINTNSSMKRLKYSSPRSALLVALATILFALLVKKAIWRSNSLAARQVIEHSYAANAGRWDWPHASVSWPRLTEVMSHSGFKRIVDFSFFGTKAIVRVQYYDRAELVSPYLFKPTYLENETWTRETWRQTSGGWRKEATTIIRDSGDIQSTSTQPLLPAGEA